MSGQEFDDFLNKFVKLGEPIKAEKFLLNLLVGEDQTDILRQDFKSKFLLPLFNKMESFKEGLVKNREEADKISEELISLKEEIKKGKQQFLPQKDIAVPVVGENKTPTISSTPLTQEKTEPVKDLNFLSKYIDNKDTSKKLTDISNILYKNSESNIKNLQNLVEKISTNKTNSVQEIGQEQKTLGPKETVISFSASTNDFISNKINEIIKGEDKKELDNVVIQDQRPKGGIMDFITGLVTGLPALLAAVGGATVLAGMFWPEIKKFIGDKFGDKAAEVFGQLQGTVNAIGKFFTIGGLQLKFGGMFKNVGELLGRMGDDLINSFKGIFLGLADEGAEGAAKGAAAAITKGGMFKGILKGAAGAILKGTSKVVLKGIPLIGALISFADAYGRFKEGNIIQGTIDIAAGLTGLIPGLGTPISIGLSLLNAFIDTRGENKEEVKQQSINISSMLLKGVGMFAKVGSKLKFLPLIGTVMSFASAWDRFKNGEVIKGVLDVASGIAGLFPGVGTALSIGVGALNAFLDYQEEKSGFASTSVMLGSWVKGLWDWAKNTSFVKTILNLTEGITDMLSPSNMRKGLETLNQVPYFGSFAGVLLSIVDSFQTTTDANGNKKTNFSFTSLANNLKKNIFKNMSALIPEGMGIRKWFAELLGVDYNQNDDTESQKPIATVPKRELSKVEKQVIKNLPTEYNEEDHNKVQEEGKTNIARRKEIDSKLETLKNSTIQTPEDKADIKRLEQEKSILMEDQMARSYKAKRYKELKDGSKITTTEDYGITAESEKADLEKEIQGLEGQIKKLKSERGFSRDEGAKNKVKELNDKINELKTPSIPILDGSKGVDLFSDAIKYSSLSKQFNSLTYQSPNSLDNFSIRPAQDDHLFAMKKGGAIDNTFKDLKAALDVLSFNITNLIKTNSQNQQQIQPQQPIIVNNNSTEKSFDDHIKFSADRDEICYSRLEWVRDNAYTRII
jgi:hypothetical protein